MQRTAVVTVVTAAGGLIDATGAPAPDLPHAEQVAYDGLQQHAKEVHCLRLAHRRCGPQSKAKAKAKLPSQSQNKLWPFHCTLIATHNDYTAFVFIRQTSVSAICS